MLLIKNIHTIWMCDTSPIPLLRGRAMSHFPTLENAFLLIEDGKIHSFGKMEDCPESSSHILDAAGGHVLPAWVDCHTHAVFPGWRNREMVYRIQGMTYPEIAAKGGGILNSAKRLRQMAEDELFDLSLARLHKIIACGTGAIEIKSGYGLTVDSELKMLRVIKRLKSAVPIPIKATFLGAHAYPPEFAGNREAYIRLITEQMLPAVAAEELADYVDAFCEVGFFSVDETERIIQAAARYGLPARIHVNQFTHSGGIEMCIRNKVLSVEHLECLNDKEIGQLKNSQTMAVLLPGASFFLNQPYPPARKLVDNGIAFAVASDFNPGTSPNYNMAFIWSLACLKMKLLPEEALAAMTINAAYSLGLQGQLGSIEPGKKARIILTVPADELSFFPYHYGENWTRPLDFHNHGKP